MKKFLLYFGFLFVVLFSFNYETKANDEFTCSYYDESTKTSILAIRRNGWFKASLRTNYGNQKAGSLWDISDFKAENGCPNYLYYKQNTGGIFGADLSSDKVYGSNSATIDKKYDVSLKLQGPYSSTKKSAVLKELFCDYNNGQITVRISEDSSYEVYNYQSQLFKSSIVNGGIPNYVSIFKDNFSIRHFWNEDTGVYACPSAILYGEDNVHSVGGTIQSFEIGYETLSGDFDKNWYDIFIGRYPTFKTLELSPKSSYILSDTKLDTTGQLCTFTKEGESDEWYFSLTGYSSGKYIANFKESVANNKIIEPGNITVTGGLIQDSCDGLPVVYSDCLTTNNCKISETEFTGSTKFVGSNKNKEDIKTVINAMGEISGDKYKKLVCELQPYLSKLPSSLANLEIYGVGETTSEKYTNSTLPCKDWGAKVDYKCIGNECADNVRYEAEQQIKDIANYCTTLYGKYNYYKNQNSDLYFKRLDECISFDKFYSQLVVDKVINDLGSNCPFITKDLGDKLIFVLDIMKIAAPIIALALGTFDFIKTIAAGDADKELKSSFKRFLTRVGAAILLLIIPVILAFILDIFLENQDGYNGDNPFCGLIDFEEKS